MVYRFVTLDGRVSAESCSIVEAADKKNILTVETESGERIRLHKRRILPDSEAGRAVAIKQSGKYKGICPSCLTELDVCDDQIDCPTCGVCDVTYYGRVPGKVNTSKRRPKTNKKEKIRMTTTETKADVQPAAKANVISLDDLKEYGEVWVSGPRSFDHANIDVRTVTILADSPPRKFVFNIYDGGLGKKKQISDLPLAAFKANEHTDGRCPWHALKADLADARKKLEQKGYTQQ